MNSVKEQILDDLSKDLRRKVAQNLHDFLELCRVAKLDYRESAGEVMYMLVDLTTSYAAMTTNVDANEFARIMGLAYLRAKRRHDEEEKRENQGID